MRRSQPRNGGNNPDRDEVDKPSGLADKANIPTDFLRTFVTICELGSFTKAAHRFGLTQPAVSAQIRKLELMIGGGLIERKSPGIGLTDRGTEVLKFARRMLSINDQIIAFSGAN